MYILKFVDILALFLFIRQKEHHHSFYASIISPLRSQVLSSSSSFTSFPFFHLMSDILVSFILFSFDISTRILFNTHDSYFSSSFALK